jgi:hypothetical protein
MANRTAQSHRHPADEDLLAWLEGDLVWLNSLRVRLHLLRCKPCLRRLGMMEERLFSIAPVSGQELAGIRANLLQAMRAYENQPLLAGPFTTQLRGAIEEFLGARMSAQLSERILHASDPHAAYADVDRTFRLLLGAKAADGLKAKLLPEPPQ